MLERSRITLIASFEVDSDPDFAPLETEADWMAAAVKDAIDRHVRTTRYGNVSGLRVSVHKAEVVSAQPELQMAH